MIGEVSCTEKFILVIETTTPQVPEAKLLRLATAATIQMLPQGGWVDAHAVARCIVKRRAKQNRPVTFEQTKDYIQHLFREMPFFCRHADGHHYRLHADPKCSVECDEIFHQNPKVVTRDHCEFCHLEVTTSGECPLGC